MDKTGQSWTKLDEAEQSCIDLSADGAAVPCKSKISQKSCVALCKNGSTACKIACTKKGYCPCKLRVTKQTCATLCIKGNTPCRNACSKKNYCPCKNKLTKQSCSKICKSGSTVCKTACNKKKLCPPVKYYKLLQPSNAKKAISNKQPYACWLDNRNRCYIGTRPSNGGGPKCIRTGILSNCVCEYDEKQCLQYCDNTRRDLKFSFFGTSYNPKSIENTILYRTCCASPPDCDPQCVTRSCICAKAPAACPFITPGRPVIFPWFLKSLTVWCVS